MGNGAKAARNGSGVDAESSMLAMSVGVGSMGRRGEDEGPQSRKVELVQSKEGTISERHHGQDNGGNLSAQVEGDLRRPTKFSQAY